MRPVFLALILCLAPVPARALCVSLGLGFKNLPATVTYAGGGGGYNVFDTTEHMQTVTFEVEALLALVGCNYRVFMSGGTYGNVNQRIMQRADAAQLNYNVWLSPAKTAILKAPGAGAAERINGNFGIVGIGASNSHSFYWTADPLQMKSADNGWFTDTVTVTIYQELVAGIYTAGPSANVTFRARAESSVDLSLVDSGGGFDIGDTAQTVDFGDLSPGESLSYDTLIRSNDGYAVTMQSQNAQKMKHQTLADTVGYAVSFDGGAVDLSGGGAVGVKSGSGVTPATGARFATEFTVGAMTGAEAAGTYEDVITVTVSAN